MKNCVFSLVLSFWIVNAFGQSADEKAKSETFMQHLIADSDLIVLAEIESYEAILVENRVYTIFDLKVYTTLDEISKKEGIVKVIRRGGAYAMPNTGEVFFDIDHNVLNLRNGTKYFFFLKENEILTSEYLDEGKYYNFTKDEAHAALEIYNRPFFINGIKYRVSGKKGIMFQKITDAYLYLQDEKKIERNKSVVDLLGKMENSYEEIDKRKYENKNKVKIDGIRVIKGNKNVSDSLKQYKLPDSIYKFKGQFELEPFDDKGLVKDESRKITDIELAAGVGEVLVISGSGLGNERGNSQILFRNTDDFNQQTGEFRFLNFLDDFDYLVEDTDNDGVYDTPLWTDTEIRVQVPSTVVKSTNGTFPSAGSGTVLIDIEGVGEFETDEEVEITASISNRVFVNSSTGDVTRKEIAFHARRGCSDEIVFHLSSAISGIINEPKVLAIEKALADWTAFTGMGLILAKGADGSPVFLDRNSESADGINLIFFDPDVAAMRTYRPLPSFYSCSSSTTDFNPSDWGRSIFREADIGINFNAQTPWDYSVDGFLNGADFYAAILHEIGHVIGLAHEIDDDGFSRGLMHFRVEANTSNRQSITSGDGGAGLGENIMVGNSQAISWNCVFDNLGVPIETLHKPSFNCQLAPPTGLRLLSVGQSSARVAWLDRSFASDGFEVEFRTESEEVFTFLGKEPYNVPIEPDQYNALDINGFPNLTTYYIRIRHFMGNEVSEWRYFPPFNTGIIVGLGDLSKVENFSASRLLTSSFLSWEYFDIPNVYFQVQKSDKPFFQSAEVIDWRPVPISFGLYIDSDVEMGKSYYYRIRAISDDGIDFSFWSSMRQVDFVDPPAVAPEFVNVSTASQTKVDLEWTQVGEDGYVLERAEGSLSGATFVQVKTFENNETSYTDFALTESTTYHYRIKSENRAGSSPYSSIQTVNTNPSSVPSLAAPFNLTATTEGSNRIRLDWETVADHRGDGFIIERHKGKFEDIQNNPNSILFEKVGQLNGKGTTYYDNGLSPTTKYWYRVRTYSE